MLMKRPLFFNAGSLLLSILLLFTVSSCNLLKNSSPTAPTQTYSIQTGPTTQLASQVISSATGGTTTIQKPGDPLNGMTLTIPDTAYPDDRTFTISSAPITGHNYGSLFNPISPLITISNGGDYSTTPMTVTIPVSIPSGDFAMIFMYNTQTGQMEGMPLIDEDSVSITGVTMHFAQSALSFATHRSSKSGSTTQGLANSTDFLTLVVSAIPRNQLGGDIQTGFTPGTDDWEFPNYGSTVESGGQCAGQSMSMMWYFNEQKEKTGAPPLWGRYNMYGLALGVKPAIWQADTLGYKFASMVQHDYAISVDVRTTAAMQSARPSLAFYAFSYAFMFFKQPQYVRLHRDGGGHAIVAYGITGGSLNVADPNFPGIANLITQQFGAFQPYNSAENANTAGHLYDTVQYMGVSAMINPAEMSNLWAQVQNGTIGNGAFPQSNIQGQDTTGAFVNMSDGLTIRDSILTVVATNSCYVERIYDENQQQLPFISGTAPGVSAVELLPGSHRLGFYITDNTFETNWAGYREYTVHTGNQAEVIMPLAAGNYWVYADTTFNPDGSVALAGIDTLKIGSQKVINGTTWYYLNPSTAFAINASYPLRYALESDGLYQQLDNISSSTPTRIVKFPASKGDSFDTIDYSQLNNIIEDYVVAATDTNVTVPQSSYFCYKYVFQYFNGQWKPYADSVVANQINSDSTCSQYSCYTSYIGLVEKTKYRLNANGKRYIWNKKDLIYSFIP